MTCLDFNGTRTGLDAAAKHRHTCTHTHARKGPVKTVQGETDSRVLFCQRNTLFLQNVNILIYLNSSLQTRPPLFLFSSSPLFCNLSFSSAQCPAALRCPLSLWELVMSVLTLTNTGGPDRLVLLLSLSPALSSSRQCHSHAKKSLPSQTLKPVTPPLHELERC